MVMELTIIPLGSGRPLSGAIPELVKMIEGSGLDYRMTAFGTSMKGCGRRNLRTSPNSCRFAMRGKSERVLAMMRLDDYGERSGEIEGAVDRVEKKLGQPVKGSNL